MNEVRRLLSIPEVVSRLGVSKSTVHRLIRSREIESVMIGGRRLIDVEALDRFIGSLASRAS